MELELEIGTRAKGTESLVYRILQTPEYRTVPIVERFIGAALVAGKKGNTFERAQNIIKRIEKYGDSAIPKNEFELISWSDLSVAEGSAKDRKKAPRTFKACAGCGRRFLAKRANNLTCSNKCRLRANRRNRLIQITETTLLKAA